MQIDAMDYDALFGDDLIGTTIIDLEDRFFSVGWNTLRDKPIEYRQIYHESTSLSQGVIKLWLEISSNSIPLADRKLWNITPQPPVEMEIRICVLKCEGIPNMDIEGTSDAFLKGFFDSSEEIQETDTHYRNQDGEPDFQYRLLYRVKVPRKDYKFTLQCYDRDFFKSNDMIGEARVDLKQIVEDGALIKQPLNFNKKFYDDVLKVNGYQKISF